MGREQKNIIGNQPDPSLQQKDFDTSFQDLLKAVEEKTVEIEQKKKNKANYERGVKKSLQRKGNRR